MTASIAALPQTQASEADAPYSDGLIGIRSNIARDALKRASDFKTQADCVFEGVANAYEAYNQGETPRVWLDIARRGKDTVVMIRDEGVGMCLAKGLARFFALHLKTARRENGLNMRGYNGTGKIAPFKFATRMQVETVKGGFRNIAVLTAEMLERAAADEVQPHAQLLVKNRPTEDRSGTTITVSGIRKGFSFNAETMRDIRKKLASEQMMWMRNAEIYVNGELLEPQKVDSTEQIEIASACGNFFGTIYHHATEAYQHELPAVYISAGRVFVAREQFGMEGRRFRQNVHVDIRTTEEWAREHFYDNRERFVSESRDLKLKLDNNPEAQALKEFVEAEVGAFMDELDRREDERRQKSMDEHQALLESALSELFSGIVFTQAGDIAKAARPQRESDKVETVTHTRREPRRNGDGEKRCSRISIEFAELPKDQEYLVDYDAKRIKINKDYKTLRAVSAYTSSPAYRLASLDLATNAFCELAAHEKVLEEFAEGEYDVIQVLEKRAEVVRFVRSQSSDHAAQLYTRFAEAMDGRWA